MAEQPARSSLRTLALWAVGGLVGFCILCSVLSALSDTVPAGRRATTANTPEALIATKTEAAPSPPPHSPTDTPLPTPTPKPTATPEPVALLQQIGEEALIGRQVRDVQLTEEVAIIDYDLPEIGEELMVKEIALNLPRVAPRVLEAFPAVALFRLRAYAGDAPAIAFAVPRTFAAGVDWEGMQFVPRPIIADLGRAEGGDVFVAPGFKEAWRAYLEE